MADDVRSFAESLTEVYAMSEENLMNASTTEQRKEEVKVFDITASQLQKRSQDEQRAFEADREYELKKAKNDAEIAKIKAETEAVQVQLTESKKNNLRNWITGIVIGIGSTAATIGLSFVAQRVELSEGRTPTAERVQSKVAKAVEALAKKVTK